MRLTAKALAIGVVGCVVWIGCNKNDGIQGPAEDAAASDARTNGGSDGGGSAGDGDTGEPCGNVMCEPGMECCNASCGICAPPNAGCTQQACVDGGNNAGGDGGSSCTDQECGPAPGAPNTQCSDGTVAGPVCTRDDQGQCGWQFRSCPECGNTGETCSTSEYCNYRPEDECGATNATSPSCEARPDACRADYDPVCGCDGNTYSNACKAHAAGMGIRAEGEC